jgi:osmotically inducible protein OsmC
MDGKGALGAGTGAFSVPVAFPRRIGEPEGVTSPEELVASAHAACYAMVVAGALGRAQASARRTTVTCTVTAHKGDAGIKLTSSAIHVVGEGLSGIDADAFAALVTGADARCPISNALRPALEIRVSAEAR